MNAVNSEAFEMFLSAGKCDAKGREIGFTVGLRNVDGVDYAWVQKAVRVRREISDFGPYQRSKAFRSADEARRWAYATAKQRIASLNAA